MAVKRKNTPPGVRPVRHSMVTISDAETTEEARQESIRQDQVVTTDRATMPAPPAAIGSFSIELNVHAADVDFKAELERGAFREALVAARERLSVSPADSSALRTAQRAEEALAEELVAALGGADAQVILVRLASEDETSPRDLLLQRRLEHGPLTLTTLLDTQEMGRIETLDRIGALHARGHVRVNLSDQKKLPPEGD